MPRKIGVIIPFEGKRKWMFNRNTSSIVLFAKKILDKYNVLGTYGFNEATMVFLEQLAWQEQQGKDIKEQIEFTVKLMMLRQNKNYVAKDIISGHTAFQRNVTNHVLVNMNRLLTVDKRIYSELNQLSRNNGKIKEAYHRIKKLENYEKKMMIQVQNQQTIKPKSLQRSFYQLFQRMFRQSQMKLSQQIFKESVSRQQYQYNVNKLLELNTWRNDLQKHEFLHVMQHGTLEERREAMEILKSAVVEVNRVAKKKEEYGKCQDGYPELLLLEIENKGQIISVREQMSHLLKQIVTNSHFMQEAICKEVWVGICNQLKIGGKQIVQKGTGQVHNGIYQRLLSQSEERTQFNRRSWQIQNMSNVLFNQVGKKVSNHVLNQIVQKVEKQLEKRVGQVRKEYVTFSQPGKVSNQLFNQVENKISNYVTSEDEKKLNNHVMNKIEQKVEKNISNHVTNETEKKVSNHVLNQIDQRVENQLEKQAEQVKKEYVTINQPGKASNQLFNQVEKKISNHLTNEVEKKLSNHVTNEVEKKVTNHVMNEIEQKIENHLAKQAEQVKKEYVTFSQPGKVSNQLFNQVEKKISNQLLSRIQSNTNHKTVNRVVQNATIQLVKRDKYIMDKHLYLTDSPLINKEKTNQANKGIIYHAGKHMISVQESELVVHKKRVERHLEITRNHTQEKELMQLKEALKRQEIIQIQDKHTVKEIQKQLARQDKLVAELISRQHDKEKPASIANSINRQLKSELHIDRMRYGLD